ncbi:hypothetical protein J2Y69_002741 [Microbacterium resistens]|uniref:Uncharacterized protein n=1 Tax=Microbacterium resistens TaxID=156977 RepID=A0ABU1SEU3_9MICO|nr:hypothetical protein [Microbacterium resistens]MDR6868130.1 hypothetical protein [Microbacterium resistens]
MDIDDGMKAREGGWDAFGVPRRTIVKGAAWSIPIIATAVALPGASASSGCQTVTFEAPALDPTSPEGVTTTFIVPAGVTKLGFAVAGGGGGGGSDPLVNGTGDNINPFREGGSGGLVTGEMSVTPGQALTLIVGQGGELPITTDEGTKLGGRGYGNGGDALRVATNPPATTLTGTITGGSGGGGSAILVGNVPLIVSGGGGGAGSKIVRRQDPVPWTATGGAGGAANSDSEDYTLTFPPNFSATGTGGGGAVGATPGAGGAVPPTPSPYQPGFPLRGGSAGSGRNGANGNPVQALGEAGGQVFLNFSASSGGGGGGYAGGGSGGAVASAHWTGAPPAEVIGVVGGPGGGGSNYVAAGFGGVTVLESTQGLAANGGEQNTVRPAGWITLSYQLCV